MDRFSFCGDLTGTWRSKWTIEGSWPQSRVDFEGPENTLGR